MELIKATIKHNQNNAVGSVPQNNLTQPSTQKTCGKMEGMGTMTPVQKKIPCKRAKPFIMAANNVSSKFEVPGMATQG